MAKQRLFLRVFVAGMLAALLIPAMNADPVKKATSLAVFEPIEIPGVVLQPGNYVVKVPDPVTHADMVGFYNQDESQLIKLVRTIPSYRLEVRDKTVITFEERANGAPDAIKTWFFPGDNWGREFVYSKAETLAAVEEVAPVLVDREPAIVALAPEAEAPAAVIEAAPEPVAETAAGSVEIAEANPPAAEAPAPIEALPQVEALPQTGSSLPLIALLGTGLLALGMALRLRLAKAR